MSATDTEILAMFNELTRVAKARSSTCWESSHEHGRRAASLTSTGHNRVPHSLKMWRTLSSSQAVRAGSVSGPHVERTSAAFVPTLRAPSPRNFQGPAT